MNIIGENIQGREDPGKGGYMTAISKQAGALLAATLILAGCAGCAMGIAEGGTRESAITLVENTWTDGNITETMSEQWFAFTAISAGAYYLHVGFGTLTHLYVQAYDSGNNPIGGEIYFGGGGSGYTALTVRSGKTYLKIRPYSGGGVYRIAFNTMESPPLPPGASSTAETLVQNVWKNGAFTSSTNEQWFKFFAHAGTNYLHVRFVTLPGQPGLYVQFYDRDGGALESGAYLTGSATYTALAVSSDQLCYVRVSGRESGAGSYRIAFNASDTPPPAN